jgi:hypothetical protein
MENLGHDVDDVLRRMLNTKPSPKNQQKQITIDDIQRVLNALNDPIRGPQSGALIAELKGWIDDPSCFDGELSQRFAYEVSKTFFK